MKKNFIILLCFFCISCWKSNSNQQTSPVDVPPYIEYIADPYQSFSSESYYCDEAYQISVSDLEEENNELRERIEELEDKIENAKNELETAKDEFLLGHFTNGLYAIDDAVDELEN